MKRIHYGWAVCLGGALSLFIIMGFGINTFSVYQPYIIELNGFTNAQGSWITTVRSLFTLLAMLTVNQLCARLGIRRVMTLGAALMVLSCVCFGFARSFPVYCAAAALTGLAYGYGGMVPLSVAIANWFRDKRSFALGLAAAGSGVSTVFAPPIVTRMIEGVSMRFAFLAEAVFLTVVGLLVWLLVREKPEDMGMQPYHLGGEEAPVPPPKPAPEGMTRGLWWSLLLASFLIGGPGGPGFSHLTVLYTSSGYDSMFVAAMLSYLGFMISVGKIVCGQIYDKLGSWRGNIYLFGVFLLALGMNCLAPLGGAIPAIIAMTLFGLGIPISTVPFAMWAADLLGDEGYKSALRSMTVAYSVGLLAFGPIAGILADWFGSYVPAYVVFVAMLVAAMVLVQRAYRVLGVDQTAAKKQ